MRERPPSRKKTSARWIDSDVEAGIPPKDLLRAMTITAARGLVERERGTLRAGMAADIIATAGNPLDDVQVLKHVAFVMKNGKIIRRLPTILPRQSVVPSEISDRRVAAADCRRAPTTRRKQPATTPRSAAQARD